MMFLALFSALGHGASIDVQVHGVVRGHAVEVLAEDAGEWVSVSCQDRGTGRDAAVDGAWTCPPLVVSAASGRITALVDGTTFLPLVIDFGDGSLYLRKSGRSLEVVAEAAVPVPGAVAAGPGMILMARMTMENEGRAPLMMIRNAAGQPDFVCRDDGAFFDAQPNDAEYLCAGWLPGLGSSETIATDLLVRNEIGSERHLGTLSFRGGSGLRYAQLDAAGEVAPSNAPFRLPVTSDGRSPRAVTHAYKEEDPSPEGTVTHVTMEHDPNPVVEALAPASVVTSRWGPMTAVLTVLALFFGGCVGWQVRSLRRTGVPLPRQLKIVASRPAMTDGPPMDGPPIVVYAEDPPAAVRDLMERLSPHRRVVVLAPDEVQMIPGVYRCRSDDVEDLVDAVRQLVARDGLPVAVVIRGRDTLKNRSAPTPDALTDGLDALAPMAWTAVVLEEGEPPVLGPALWRVDAGGRWVPD